MSESLLTVLKICFLALLFLFLLRVVRVVTLELRAAPVTVPAPPEPSAEGRRRSTRRGPRLRLLEPPSRRDEVHTIGDELTVGRAGGCALVLADDTYVSQVHARLFSRDGHTWVEDLGSTNGTLVNGQRIESPTRLRRGDRVQFGQTVGEVVR
ncbi:MAG: FHA domain-containing protein [Acidimicrobiia bacterium]|nr:FHA domain-containing protein [Acidimicrobiia bacterium]